jgi:phytoene dehydrogenase-like protein
MSQKSILIVGAGVAGLCAGIYGQMNGYQTRIYEQHKFPGGLVTAFRRKGFLVDVCVHWLTGSGPGIHLHRYWNEVGLLEGRKFIPLESYGVYHGKDGRTVSFYCDPDRLEKHLLQISLEDAPVIHELVEGVRFGIRFKTPEKLQYEASTFEWIKTIVSMVPLLGGIQKWTRLTVGELAGRFQSQLIRDALNTVYAPGSPSSTWSFPRLALCTRDRLTIRSVGRFHWRSLWKSATNNWAGRCSTMHAWRKSWSKTGMLSGFGSQMEASSEPT